VYSRFSPFGSIVKILIFEKGEMTKFFLEYLEIENAVKVKNKSNIGKKLLGWF
jgi:hypothetical protein